jgi:hypothetical protein
MDMKAMGSQIRHRARNGQQYFNGLRTLLWSTYPESSSALLEIGGFAEANLDAVRQTWRVECSGCCELGRRCWFGEEVRGGERS